MALESFCNCRFMGNIVQIVDTINDLLAEASNCNIPIPVSKSTELLTRILEGFLSEKDSPLSVIRMNLGDGIVNALVNSILGSFAGSMLVNAKNMSKEEAEQLISDLDKEAGEA